MGFLADFMGDSQRKDLEAGKAASDAALKSGYDDASSTYKQYGQQALGYMQPYADNGGRANTLYSDSLGMNGAQGGQNALMAYQNGRNPYLDYQMDQAQKGTDRMANARGNLNSGANALAASRVRQQMGYQDYSGWQNQLMGASQQGQQAAGGMAQMAQGQGQYLGDLRSGYGQQQAGSDTSYANSQAASRSVGINNLLALGGLGVKAMGGGAKMPGMNPGMGNF